ncbi:unnamed protein product [Linum trigynum]|uniref:Uncharacterized protein n=1 Tax=Linum trigynum TaxID=586398 RepID=A0AAV2CAP9_9ROSI
MEEEEEEQSPLGKMEEEEWLGRRTPIRKREKFAQESLASSWMSGVSRNELGAGTSAFLQGSPAATSFTSPSSTLDLFNYSLFGLSFHPQGSPSY